MNATHPRESPALRYGEEVKRSVGTSVSAAVVGVVLSQLTIDLGGRVLPSEDGFRAGLLIGCGVALLAGAIALAIPGRGRSVTAVSEEEAAPAVESAASKA
ncbi:hypothetical protein [Actinomadura sp. WMMA1423]|uniref:hypothetical protein n=1 Tax=Actinomadura sp. WMMA1423 TaxID=2591108 RepID=UPI00197AE6E7|nr:hypothetical protein [Actinomadura sp. WMMA1423]